MTKLLMQRDDSGFNTFGLEFSNQKYNTVLTVGAAQSLTIPSDNASYLAIFAFEPGANVWVANNTTATAPGGTFAATACELNPVARIVKAGDVLSFIVDNVNADLGVSLYAIQQ